MEGSSLYQLAKAKRAGKAAIEMLEAANKTWSSGKVVLGHFPEYVETANELGARHFSVPETVWNRMSDAERWAANQKFLDRAIKRGAEFILATSVDKMKPDSFFERELKYLFSKGYKLASNGTRLIRGD